MKKKILFIVESPTKIKTLQKILHQKAENYQFVATLGHIMDLPINKLGVNLNNFEPNLIILSKKEKILKYLTKLAEKSSTIYLATDPDREGEAISVHLYEYLIRKGNLKNPHFKRIELHEITELGLERALKNARFVDYNLYNSWKARRVLDRLIGYLLSPKISKFFKRALSAGRVQSPALKLCVEREIEIENFKPEKTFSLTILATSQDGKSYELELSTLNKLFKSQNKEELLDFFNDYLYGSLITLEKIKSKEVKKQPPLPLKTTTLIEVSGKTLGFSPKETMQIAQALYEKGLITYMRTDSIRVSPIAVNQAKIYIEKVYGKDYVGGERRVKKKGLIQDAHECIRPTNILKTEKSQGLTYKEKLLYELIFSHFIASQMKPALFREDFYFFKNEKMPSSYYLQIKNKVLLFDGFLRVLGAQIEEGTLLNLREGEVLKVESYKIKEHISQPPERYTSHSLIKKLEDLGIGRPSTYPTILDNLLKRGYVIIEGKYLKPTELGKKVWEYLEKNTKLIMDYSFTAQMEKALDELCEGKKIYTSLLSEYYQILEEYLLS
ncbi:MAG: type I DNA topoisomerase [Caldimicrobium sp.]